jgi:CRP-like cAMP-binding protein
MPKVVKLLEVLADDDISWLLSNGVEQQFEPGSTIIREGEFIEFIYIVLEGLMGVFLSVSGDKQIATISTGEIVGEISYIDDQPTSASVIAVENTLLLAIARSAIDEKIAFDPLFGVRFYKAIGVSVSQRLRNTLRRMNFILEQIEQAKHWRDDQ